MTLSICSLEELELDTKIIHRISMHSPYLISFYTTLAPVAFGIFTTNGNEFHMKENSFEIIRIAPYTKRTPTKC